MAASTAGAVKAFLETKGLGVAIYRDRAPTGTVRPYITVHEGIDIGAEVAFSAFDDTAGHVVELAQVDVWQAKTSESYTLPDAVTLALTGAVLTALPTFGGHVRVQSRVRLIEDGDTQDPTIHDALTIEVRRTLARRP